MVGAIELTNEVISSSVEITRITGIHILVGKVAQDAQGIVNILRNIPVILCTELVQSILINNTNIFTKVCRIRSIRACTSTQIILIRLH